MQKRRARCGAQFPVALIAGAALIFLAPALAQGRRDYARIDAYAYRAPAAAERSVRALAAYLAGPASNEAEKARAFFTWITCNIAYDTKDPKALERDAAMPQTVLAHRRANCEGYSRLFEAMAQEAAIRCGVLRGYVKRGRYPALSNREMLEYHSWNVVHLDGRWLPVDCTLGAGYLDEGGMFVRSFEDFFFLTSPESFIHSHFPDDARWQLLARPVTRPQFELQIHPRPVYFRYRLSAQSHRSALLAASGKLEVTLEAPPAASLGASLVPVSPSLREVHLKKRSSPACTFVQRLRERWHITAIFPRAGSYSLRILVKEKFAPKPFEEALSYRVESSTGLQEPYGFPTAFATFSERDALLSSPLDRYLHPGKAQRFRLTLPGACSVSVIAGRDLFPLARSGDEFEGTVTIPRETDVVSVCAEFPGSEKPEMLLIYRVRSQAGQPSRAEN